MKSLLYGRNSKNQKYHLFFYLCNDKVDIYKIMNFCLYNDLFPCPLPALAKSMNPRSTSAPMSSPPCSASFSVDVEIIFTIKWRMSAYETIVRLS